MSTLFNWFKSASKEPDKKNPDHNISTTKKQTNFSKTILNLMKKKKEITNGYYLEPKLEPKLDPEAKPSPKNKT